MSRIRTTRDVFELEVNYGYGDGWEYVAGADTRKEARQYQRDYQTNSPQYPTRIIRRRERVA